EVNDRISDLLQVINEKGFTKFPIYEGNKFRGLISQKGITNWLATRADNIPQFNETLLKEVLACVQRNNYKFLKSNASVYRAEEIFKEQIGKGNRIEALLITRNSSFKEDLEGIITNWDIMKV